MDTEIQTSIGNYVSLDGYDEQPQRPVKVTHIDNKIYTVTNHEQKFLYWHLYPLLITYDLLEEFGFVAESDKADLKRMVKKFYRNNQEGMVSISIPTQIAEVVVTFQEEVSNYAWHWFQEMQNNFKEIYKVDIIP